jgi:hypothetical protein
MGLPARFLRVAGPGPPMVLYRPVGDQVMGRRVGDGGGDDVAGPDVGAHRGQMHQPAVAGTPGHPGGAGVLPTLPRSHQ